jgi:hypothetical protein
MSSALIEFQKAKVTEMHTSSDKVLWNFTIIGSSSGRIGRMIIGVPFFNSRR